MAKRDEDGIDLPPRIPGLKWWTCSYQRDGATYGIDIPADTAEAALALLHEQFGHGTVDGELYGTIRGDDG